MGEYHHLLTQNPVKLMRTKKKLRSKLNLLLEQRHENADLKGTVVTRGIKLEEERYPSEIKEAAVSPQSVVVADKRQHVPVNNKKPFKKVAKHKDPYYEGMMAAYGHQQLVCDIILLHD